MAKESKEQSTQDLQIELLKAQIENLSGKISKPQTSEEEFQARLAKYEAAAPMRAEMQIAIDKRRVELMMMPELMGKARMDEIILLESWERRSKQLEAKNPHYSAFLKGAIKRKILDIQKDSLR